MSTRTGVILALIAMFLIGCAVGGVGGFVTAHLVSRGFMGHGGHSGGEHSRRGPSALLRHLEHELSLTPDQSHRIEDVLERQRGRMDALRDSTHAEIEQVLTPAQREHFRDLERRLMRFGPPPDVPGGPPGSPEPGR